MNKKGFTLIELLIVIAIIGILASVVLASINTARLKGADSAIKANLTGLRTQAQNYYDTNGNYGTPGALVFGASLASCSTASTVFDPAAASSINSGITTAENVSDGTATWVATCALSDTGSAWAVSVPLKTNATLSWCIDSQNNSKQITGALPSNTTVCP